MSAIGGSAPDPLATPSPPEAVTAIEEVIAGRRTSLLVDPDRPVPDELVDRLVAAATWAPNHKRGWPWRFTVLTGDARARLGGAMSDRAAEVGAPPAKVHKLRAKYLRSPTVLLVWQQVDPHDAVRRREDRDAVASAVQNVLLVATALGLGSYWATVPDELVPAVRQVAGVGDDHDLVALVYLGWPTGTVVAPMRPNPEVTRLD
ncbi:MAG: putative oxidoreductase [Acidimicrobiales bacterium]|nr:putative oxidoreductase [Acidimicrobiales bacterium]